MMLITIILFFVLIILFIYHWKWRHLYKISFFLDGPFALPIVGNALIFWCKQEEMLAKFDGLLKKYQTPMRIWLGSKLIIFISDVDSIQQTLLSQKLSDKDDIYRFFEPFTGNGLLNESGPKWRHHRKIITPTFNNKILLNYLNIFEKQSELLIKKLGIRINEEPFDFEPYAHECVIRIVCETIMDLKFNSNDTPDNFIYYVERMNILIYERMVKVWLQPDFIYNRTRYAAEQNKIRSVLRNFILELIEKKKLEINQAKTNNNFKQLPVLNRCTMDQLLLLMEDDPNILSTEELIDEMLTLFIASEDAITIHFCFSILMLGLHQNIQDKVFGELNDIFTNNKPITISTLNELEYLEMVIKESLRLFPVGPYILRMVKDDFYLKNNIILPKGSTLGIPIYNVHRDPKHWEKPEQFYPEHFLPDAVQKRHPCAYLPFSYGPRNCIGQQYAMLCLKILIVNVLRNFHVFSNGHFKDIILKCDISIRALNGYKIQLKKRDIS